MFLDRSFHYVKEEEEDRNLMLLHSQIPAMEALMTCVEMSWMAILVRALIAIMAAISCGVLYLKGTSLFVLSFLMEM